MNSLSIIAYAAARGRYRLLLGAGASAGATSRDGALLPLASGLQDELLALAGGVSATDADRMTLARAYRLARSRKPSALGSYLRARFSRCSPSWQSAFALIPWTRIWTFNLDDVLEQAFDHVEQRYESFSWRDAHRDTADTPGAVQIVHLHGRSLDSDEFEGRPDVVMGLDEYAQATNDRRTWHSVFVDDFVDMPFVVIGTRLSDEFDIMDALQHGSQSANASGYRSFIVLDTVSDLQREELEALGLVVIESDAATFVAALATKVGEERKRLLGTGLSATIFARQFISLRDWSPRPKVTGQEFLTGSEPDWALIREGDPVAHLGVFNTIADDAATIPWRAFVLIHGAPGSGKTTAMLGAAQRLIAQGLEPMWFRGEEAIDVSAVVSALAHSDRLVLLFDNAAEFAFEIDTLLQRAEQDGIPAKMILSERTNRLHNVLDRLAHRFRHGNPIEVGILDVDDVTELITVLDRVGRLGRLTRETQEQRRLYFAHRHRNRLWSAMAEIEVGGGQSWRRKWVGTYRSLDAERTRDLLAVVSIAEYVGNHVRLPLASRVAGLEPTESATLMERGAPGRSLAGRQRPTVTAPDGLRGDRGAGDDEA